MIGMRKYLDKKAVERADQTLARIRNGEEQVYTLEQVTAIKLRQKFPRLSGGG
jgi:hypothetical protein